ncbi:PAS domain S-box-containing protein [Cyclobacterium xiamenense]|uniref:histidine kinase n=1 Tax=Cyclobacterium xiamenense TaxID=1297121 RepID=A0A1H6UN68_9BACT|nr:PAS domain S-box protein [Cyclobacterium xiamenense]SEI89352.1 PAS domain S-box-containing protein [Cyclobacterium xiamenense]
MLEASLDVFCTINEQGKFTFVSAAAERHWGYAPSALVGTPFVNVIVPEDVKKTNQLAKEIVQKKEIHTFLNRYRRKDGGIAYNLCSARWIPDKKLIYCVAKDAKESFEKSKILKEREERFKALVQEGSDLIAILDEESKYKYVSPTSIPILGIAPEDFLGKNVFEFIHPEDAKRTENSLKSIVDNHRVQVEPFRFRNHKNQWRWIETVLTNMLENPVIKGIVANSRDITERIEEEHRLKLLESVITNTNDVVLITEAEPMDQPGPKILYVNEAFTKMTGYASEEVLGKTPRLLQGPLSDRKALSKMGHDLRKGKASELTTINCKKNGEQFWVNFTINPVSDEMGKITHFIAIERDVTERKNKEIEKDLVTEISEIFTQESKIEVCAEKLCQTVGKYGAFDLVELWAPDLENKKIRLIGCFLPSPKDQQFYDASVEKTVFDRSEGLPGKIWAEGKLILWRDHSVQKHFVRSEISKNIGLKTLLGIPLTFSGSTYGILVVGSKISHAFPNFTSIFSHLEGFIGSEIHRKKLEEDLYRLINSVPELISVGDFQGRFLSINKEGCDMLGYAENEIIGHSFEKWIHPEDKEISKAEFYDLTNGEDTVNFETRFITKDGKVIWTSWSCKPDIKLGIIYSIAKNITEEKKFRQLTQQSFSMAKIGSWELDIVANKLSWSEEVHNLHETNPDGFEPNLATAINFYREDFRDMVRSQVESSIENGNKIDFEAIIVTKSGKEKWVRVIGKTEMVDKKPVLLFGSTQDISQRKEDQKRILDNLNVIEEQNKKLLNIAWSQSHEVRAPVARILGIVKLLEDSNEFRNDLDTWISHIKFSGEELDGIIRKIVDETRSLNLSQDQRI